MYIIYYNIFQLLTRPKCPLLAKDFFSRFYCYHYDVIMTSGMILKSVTESLTQ